MEYIVLRMIGAKLKYGPYIKHWKMLDSEKKCCRQEISNINRYYNETIDYKTLVPFTLLLLLSFYICNQVSFTRKSKKGRDVAFYFSEKGKSVFNHFRIIDQKFHEINEISTKIEKSGS